MRLVTSKRLHALGLLLLEAAGFALLISGKFSGDKEISGAFGKLWTRARAL